MSRIPLFDRTVLPDTSRPQRADVGRMQHDVNADNIREARHSALQLQAMHTEYKIREANAENATWVNENAIKARREAAELEDAQRQNRAGNPKNFSKDFDTLLSKSHEELIKSAPSEDAKNAMRGTLSSMRGQVYEQSLSWERSRQVSLFAASNKRAADERDLLSYQMGKKAGMGEQVQGGIESMQNDAEAAGIAALSYAAPEAAQGATIAAKRSSVANYLEGMSETNPEQALKELNSGKYDQTLGAEGLRDMEGIIRKNVDRVSIEDEINQLQTEDAFRDVISSNDTPYNEKIMQINEADLNGKISDKFASEARAYVNSKHELSAVTNSGVMAGIVTQMYDLNTLAEVSPKEYLRGVQNLRSQIMEKRADGTLSRDDEEKLNNQIKTLMSSKVSDATNSIAYSFGEGRKVIEASVPPEARGEAIRQLFYSTENLGISNLPPAERKVAYKKAALEVSDTLNASRRDKALGTLKKVTAPVDVDALLKSKGYTMQDVQETADKYGITPEQVIEKLRAK